MSSATPQFSPERLLQLGLGFWASKTLLSAVEIGLFTELTPQPLALEQLIVRLHLHPRSARDFLDALVSLGLLQRTGTLYSNTPETSLFLDRNKPSYVGGILEMANARLYPVWGSLTDALRTGSPQNEAKLGGDNFARIYSDPHRLREFLRGMTGVSLASAKAIAAKFPWADYKTFCDVGCAQGALPVQVALAHPHLTGGGFDLPPVGPIFDDYVRSFELTDRLKFQPGDFITGPLPTADVLVMGHILHDWNLDTKQMLIKKAYDALPPGGALLVYDAIIDDDRKQNTFGLLMSLNMLLVTSGGFDYTAADGQQWLRSAGFKSTRVEHLAAHDSMIIAIK